MGRSPVLQDTASKPWSRCFLGCMAVRWGFSGVETAGDPSRGRLAGSVVIDAIQQTASSSLRRDRGSLRGTPTQTPSRRGYAISPGWGWARAGVAREQGAASPWPPRSPLDIGRPHRPGTGSDTLAVGLLAEAVALRRGKKNIDRGHLSVAFSQMLTVCGNNACGR